MGSIPGLEFIWYFLLFHVLLVGAVIGTAVALPLRRNIDSSDLLPKSTG